jgi:mRNA-degrading endonuclease toxin of MazEF toxin-antitoxin module
MIKYFLNLLEWCKVKIVLVNTPSKNYFFKEREVWWCSIVFNVGDEEFGKGPQFLRPVLIFKKFSSNSFLGLSLTGTLKEGSWYTPSIVLGKKGSVMLNQARIFDKRRLVSRIETITGDEFENIQTRFRELYCP